MSIEHEETTFLGNSIILATSRAIAARFNVVDIDAVIGRQSQALAGVVAQPRAAERSTPVVILNIGNKGTVDVRR